MAKRYRIHTQHRIDLEGSKDDVIHTLAWLLNAAGYPVRVVFPDGYVLYDQPGMDGEVVMEEGDE